MKEVRCGKCRALLFKAGSGAITGTIEIKCRRCGSINTPRSANPTQQKTRTADHAACKAD